MNVAQHQLLIEYFVCVCVCVSVLCVLCVCVCVCIVSRVNWRA